MFFIYERGDNSQGYLHCEQVVLNVLESDGKLLSTGQHTYRNAPARDVPFTRHEAGATTYVELLEREQLEVRIVEHGGAYAKAVYYAHGQTLTEQQVRRITSTLLRIDVPTDADGNVNAD